MQIIKNQNSFKIISFLDTVVFQNLKFKLVDMDYNRVVNSLVFILTNKSLVTGINITILKRRSFMLLEDLSQQSFTHSLVNKSNIYSGYFTQVPV